MSNFENLNTKAASILKKYKLEKYNSQSKILLEELDNITNSILKRDFLRENINISSKYFDITENINILIKEIADVLSAFTYIKIKTNTLRNAKEKNFNNEQYQELLQKSQKLDLYINQRGLEYENFQNDLFQSLTQKKNKLYYALKDFYESLSIEQKRNHNYFKLKKENDSIISSLSENEENEVNEKRLSLKSLGKIEQNYNSNSNLNNYYNPPHGNVSQNLLNEPLYEEYDINNPEIRKLENNLRHGLRKSNNFSEYPNSYSNMSEYVTEFNPLKNKKTSFSNVYSNSSDFSESKPIYKEFNIKNKNLKKLNELNKLIVKNKNLSGIQRMVYKDKIIDIMIMLLSNKIRNKYHN